MSVDLLAGSAERPVMLPVGEPARVLIFDSGLGGLTVLTETMRLLPGARHIYVADNAAFPYGALGEAALIERVARVIERAVSVHRPHLAVIACNTASTLVLPVLRARFQIPFVGTVPAIKQAASSSGTRAFAVLGTPGTIARDYTARLIQTFAADCEVILVASDRLAGLAEACLQGRPIADAAIAAEIAPCFSARPRPIDTVVLACTHYPLLRDRLDRLAPWPVTWIDPAPAIARRVAALVSGHGGDLPALPPQAVFTGSAGLTEILRSGLRRRGITDIAVDPMPLGGSLRDATV